MDSRFFSETNCKLWVLLDNPQDSWWKVINFNLGFLFSSYKNRTPHERPEELKTLIEKTKWPIQNFKKAKSWTLFSAQAHVNADWILLIHDEKSFQTSELENLIDQLGVKSVRFFAPFEPTTGLKARLDHCDLVSPLKTDSL